MKRLIYIYFMIFEFGNIVCKYKCKQTAPKWRVCTASSYSASCCLSSIFKHFSNLLIFHTPLSRSPKIIQRDTRNSNVNFILACQGMSIQFILKLFCSARMHLYIITDFSKLIKGFYMPELSWFNSFDVGL